MSTRPHVRRNDPRLAQRVALGSEVLGAAVRAHMGDSAEGFEFVMTKGDEPVWFSVTVEVSDAPGA